MAARAARTLMRILRLWRVHAWLDLLWMTRDSRYFLICYVSDVLMTVAGVTAMLLLAERFDGIGHWSKYQIIFMLGYGSAVGGLNGMFFGYNVSAISRRIGRGQMDHTLIQPQPVWMALLTEGFAPFQTSCEMIPGVTLMIWAAVKLSLPIGPAWLATLGLSAVGSCAIMLSCYFIWGTMAFWTPRAAEELSSAVAGLMHHLKLFPLDGVGPLLTSSLLSILPVGFAAWFPCRALLGLDSRPFSPFATLAVALLFLLLAAAVFRKGMKHYAKTGSQRYLSWGHRS